ncbi:MAG: hypothetical protein IPI64_10480 [Chloracidobacterium sp.]|nr:hypothetical protein [Chloracidobacterium sp.]
MASFSFNGFPSCRVKDTTVVDGAAATGAEATPRNAALAPSVTGFPVSVIFAAVPERVPVDPVASVIVSIFATLER